MKRSSLSRIVPRGASALALLAAACAQYTPPPPAPAATALTRFYAQYDALFAASARCDGGFAADASGVTSEQGARMVDDLNDAVASGCVVFDSDRAAICITQLTQAVQRLTAGCWGELPTSGALVVPAVCGEVIYGNIPTGGACASDLACRSGACDPDSSLCVAASVPQAATPVAIGADCTNAPCIAGAECLEQDGGSATCVANTSCETNADCASDQACVGIPGTGLDEPQLTCSAPLAQGAACIGGQVSNPCAAGLWCAPSQPTQPWDPYAFNGTCSPQVAAGGACIVGPTPGVRSLVSQQCAGTQLCMGLILIGTSDAAQTPGHCDVPRDVGGSCLQTGDAATTGCLIGLQCDASSHCAVPPSGAPCEQDWPTGLTVCDPSSTYCGPGSVCTPLVEDGSSCPPEDSSYVCSSGSCITSDFGGVCSGPASFPVCGSN